VLGFWPNGTSKPKPAWWRWLAILSMIALVVLALGLPTGGTFGSAAAVGMSRGSTAVLPVRGTVVDMQPDQGLLTLKDRSGRTQRVRLEGVDLKGNLKPGQDVILAMNFDHATKTFVAHRLVSTDPILTLPLIPGLEERARNLYFHVPCAWLAQLAWFVSFGYAVMFLRKRRLEDDVRASAAAGLGALFCVLATVTGAVWAKFNWGVFWNWDPRQTSIFIVLVIFGAYFALRSAIDNDDQRARVSAIYLIVLAVPVLFFMFIFPRLESGLHPGASGSENIGPVLSPQEDALDPVKQVIFALSFFSFAMLYFWMLNVAVRARLLDLRRRRREIEQSEREAAGASPAIEREVVRLT
jgi:heme exporter protein C